MGAKTRLIYDNLWRKGTMGTPSSEDPKHPATDTQADTRSMYYKALNKTSPCTVPNDLLTAQEINFVGIIDHNFGDIGAGITIDFQGADDANFTAPDLVTENLTYNVTNIFQFFTAFTRQWVQVKLTKAAGDFTNEPQFATVICGSYAELNRRFAPIYEIGEEDFSEGEYSDSQVFFSQEKETLNIRRYSYQALNDASAIEVLSMFEECKTIKAFAFCHDHSDPNPNTLWVRNSELISPECRNGVWYWEMAIKEVR